MGHNIDRNKIFIYFGTPSGGLPAVQKISSGGGSRNVLKFIIFFPDIRLALPIQVLHKSYMACFFGFYQQKKWKTNCSNKSNIFGDIATFLQQMLGKKLKINILSKK